MGYLHIAIALLFGQIKGYCGKKQSLYISGIRDAAVANFLRMLCCLARPARGSSTPQPHMLDSWIQLCTSKSGRLRCVP